MHVLMIKETKWDKKEIKYACVTTKYDKNISQYNFVNLNLTVTTKEEYDFLDIPTILYLLPKDFYCNYKSIFLQCKCMKIKTCPKR